MNRFCCDNIHNIIEGELVDTYGGDYTFMDVFVCRDCRRIFVRHYGAKPSFEEIYESDDDFEYYLFYTY